MNPKGEFAIAIAGAAISNLTGDPGRTSTNTVAATKSVARVFTSASTRLYVPVTVPLLTGVLMIEGLTTTTLPCKRSKWFAPGKNESVAISDVVQSTNMSPIRLPAGSYPRAANIGLVSTCFCSNSGGIGAAAGAVVTSNNATFTTGPGATRIFIVPEIAGATPL